MYAKRLSEIFTSLGTSLPQNGSLVVTSPQDGSIIARLPEDVSQSLSDKLARAGVAQAIWRVQKRAQRAELLERFSAALKKHREALAEIIHIEAGKTLKEAASEADSSADILIKTIQDATLPDFSGMMRCKERPPVGIVGLITSFNFPLVVANWTFGPAWLAGNAVLWKPSEKTPLAGLAAKAIFDTVAVEHRDLLQVVIGGREIGSALVAHESVDMISATGSVAMGEGIKSALFQKRNRHIAPILELGGNNGVILSERMTPAHREFALKSLLNSFLGTSGQRCTNTRRLIVHESVYDDAVAILTKLLQEFMTAHVKAEGVNPENPYGYGPLIDADAFARFEEAKKQVVAQGGRIVMGARLFADKNPGAFVVEPALALMPAQTDIMYRETFAPILFISPYSGGVANALAVLNAPENAGLVSAIYTQSQQEADDFAAYSEAGHVLINPPKGTGTPAHGMGFGGNKHSGCGEILNSVDPLQAFTCAGKFTRIAQNAEIKMDQS